VLLDQTRSPHCLFIIQERRQRAKEREPNSEPEFEWPPKRQHHTRPPSPRTKYVLTTIPIPFPFIVLNLAHDSRLLQRQIALIELKMIQTPEDLPLFAQNLYALFLLFSLLFELSFVR
jgi:hypothetical protein